MTSLDNTEVKTNTALNLIKNTGRQNHYVLRLRKRQYEFSTMLDSANQLNPVSSEREEFFSITQLSREFGITPRAMRFYEDQGLLSPKRSGLTRLYSSRDRVRLKLVLRGKRLGFSLKEIGNILDMYEAESGETGQLQYMLDRLKDQREVLKQQREDIDQTLSELDEIETQCRDRLERFESSR